jgi:hypothetical protein
LLGPALAEQVRDTALALYLYAAAHAHDRGIIVADTKFEFGVDEDGTLTLIDEALTPDSSRFWPRDTYEPGRSPPSFDKQFVRDYLETLTWDKRPPAPRLPPEVIRLTSEKYAEALRRLTGVRRHGVATRRELVVLRPSRSVAQAASISRAGRNREGPFGTAVNQSLSFVKNILFFDDFPKDFSIASTLGGRRL